MIFHENRLQAERFSCNNIPYFCRKLGKVLQNLSSAAVVTGALRVNFKKNQKTANCKQKFSHHAIAIITCAGSCLCVWERYSDLTEKGQKTKLNF